MANTNIGDHRWLAQDDLRDGPIQNIAYYLANTPVAGQFSGATRSSIVAATAAIGATETLVVNIPLLLAGTDFSETQPASLNAGSIIRATLEGTCTSSNADSAIFTIRSGILGTKADASICTGTVTTAGSGSAIPFRAMIDITVRVPATSGANGTGYGYLAVQNTGVTGIAGVTNTVVALTAITALPTLTATWLDITYISAATSATTFQTATIELIP